MERPRLFFNALYFADGNEELLKTSQVDKSPALPIATPSFLNAGRARKWGGFLFLDPGN